MTECPICGAENQPEAESCRGCGFGLSFARYTILDLAPVPAEPPPAQPEDSVDRGPPPETDSEEGPEGNRPGQASGEEPPADPDVDQLLLKLQEEGTYFVRLDALRKIGQLEASSPEIVKALLVARASGPDKQMRDAAARLLQAPPHHQVLQGHPELVEAAAAEVQSAAPRLQTPLGRLRLPGWEAGARVREPEPETEPEASIPVPSEESGESAPDGVVPPSTAEVDRLLRTLAWEGSPQAHREALLRLGQMRSSQPEVVRELLIVKDRGSTEENRQLAADLLSAPPHQEAFRQQPDLAQDAVWLADARETPALTHNYKWGCALAGGLIELVLRLIFK